jgi:LacI family transcriptional regulator
MLTGSLPEAVFCANDQMAIGLVKAMKEHHVRIPEDIAVVGFDNIQITQYIQPTLSTVGASRFEWGAKAAEYLIAFIENKSPFEPQRIPTQLIRRESSCK